MDDAYPVLKRDYPLNEKNLDFWVNDKDSPYTEVKRFDWYRGYQVGGRSLMWGRQSYRLSDFDFEANAKDGIADRLADPLRRHRALVRSRRAPRRHLRIARRAAAASRRPVPAGDAAQLRRGAVAGRLAKQFDGRRRIIPGPRREPHAAAAGPRPLPVPQRLLARLPVRRVLQHAVVDAAGRDGDRPPDAEAVRDRQRSPLRPRPQARDRRARDRRRDQRDDRLHGARSSSSARRRSTRRGC